jgi:endonuclease YncB( thermonuclease family)
MRGTLRWLPAWLFLAVAIAWATERVSQQPPQAAITVPCTMVEVHDGDTLTVDVRIPVRVRLLDCWARELREPGGETARDHLRQLAAGKRGVLHVPLAGADRTDDVLSFGRLLAHVWVAGDDRSLSARMVADGFAAKTKR